MPEVKVYGVITPQAMRRSRAACTASSSRRTHQFAIPLAESIAVSFSSRNRTICSVRGSPSRVARMGFITLGLNRGSTLAYVAARRGCESCATPGHKRSLNFRNPADSLGLTISSTVTEWQAKGTEPCIIREGYANLAFEYFPRGGTIIIRNFSYGTTEWIGARQTAGK